MLVVLLVWALLGTAGAPAISNLKSPPLQDVPSDQVVVVAQLSDLHIGLKENPLTHAPLDPLENLRRAVAMVNARRPDAVIVSGDIGETPAGWPAARTALKAVKAPLYWIPGNHDADSRSVAQYRKQFGRDYYRFRVRGVEFYVLDSQLLGNYDHINAAQPEPLPAATVAESEKMLRWLQELVQAARSKPGVVRIAVQHVPLSAGGKAPDARPYWTTQEPYRSREIALLRDLGVKDVLAGHWHKSALFAADGFTHHVAPAVSFSAGPPVGFALHTIAADGRVATEFVNLEK
jgi:3',5'-cyclic AMP phosphodiesterase CpdA